MTRAPWIATGLVLASVVGLAQTTGTSQPPAATKSSEPTFVTLRVTDVKPDMMSEYVALQKSDTIPGLKKAGIEWRDVWRAAVVGNPGTVASITPLKGLADLDSDPPMKRALGDDGYRAYMDKMNKLISQTRLYIVRGRPDLGYKNDANASGMMAKLGVLADVEVMPGRQAEFETILKTEWIPGLKKASVPSYSVSEVAFGGAIGQYFTFTPISNFAQLEKGHPIQQALGDAGYTKLMAKLGPTIRHAERIIIRYDDELSFRGSAKPKTESQ
jgi:hypothetical protein